MGYPSYRDDEVREAPEFATGVVVMAIRIARDYANRTPTKDELMSRYGMSRATAYRWVHAFKIGKGAA